MIYKIKSAFPYKIPPKKPPKPLFGPPTLMQHQINQLFIACAAQLARQVIKPNWLSRQMESPASSSSIRVRLPSTFSITGKPK